MDKDPAARLRNDHRLRYLKLADVRDIDLCCSHEGRELETMVARAAKPAGYGTVNANCWLGSAANQ